MKILTPTGNEDGMIFYGENGLNVQEIFGIIPSDFLRMHDGLVSDGLKVRLADIDAQVDFIFYCHELKVAGADIERVILEFNAAQKGDGTDLRHALSLAKLYYHYYTTGSDVRILKTNKSESTPDLVINDIKCELKVRHDQTNHRMNNYSELLLAGKHDEYHEIWRSETRSMQEDLSSARSRVNEGFRQADCVILDLSSHFHSWNFHRLASLQEQGGIRGLSAQPVPAIVGTCILFSPDNARNDNWVGFLPKAYWGYLPIDGNFLRDENQRKAR